MFPRGRYYSDHETATQSPFIKSNNTCNIISSSQSKCNFHVILFINTVSPHPPVVISMSMLSKEGSGVWIMKDDIGMEKLVEAMYPEFDT